MLRVVLDVDALSHARSSALALTAHIEYLIAALPDKAYVERSVYIKEASRTSVASMIDDWQRRGLVNEYVDYRTLSGGDERYRRWSKGKWKGLSPRDKASLVVAQTYLPSGLLTCERLLAEAAMTAGVAAIDLFDVVRLSLKFKKMTDEDARRTCCVWDGNRFAAGRPVDYKGSFEAELAHRETNRPLPL